MAQDKYILVVEDEALLLVAIQNKLKKTGLECVGATTGRQALDYLSSLESPPTAIWLDYYLPDMNGLEFLDKVKSNPLWSAIPIVVVSNSASPEKVHSMLSLGAKDYLLKSSYRLDEIIAKVVELSTTQP